MATYRLYLAESLVIERVVYMKRILPLICIVFCTTLSMVSCSSFVAIERNRYASSDSAFIKYVKEENIPYTRNNHVDILNGAHVKFDSLLTDIGRARHHIHLEYFNFRNDSINKVLISALAKKAKEQTHIKINVKNNSVFFIFPPNGNKDYI